MRWGGYSAPRAARHGHPRHGHADTPCHLRHVERSALRPGLLQARRSRGHELGRRLETRTNARRLATARSRSRPSPVGCRPCAERPGALARRCDAPCRRGQPDEQGRALGALRQRPRIRVVGCDPLLDLAPDRRAYVRPPHLRRSDREGIATRTIPSAATAARTRRGLRSTGPCSCRDWRPQRLRRRRHAQRPDVHDPERPPTTGYGSRPVGEGLGRRCTNEPRDGGTRGADTLQLVEEDGYYGHPNPVRGECDYLEPRRARLSGGVRGLHERPR